MPAARVPGCPTCRTTMEEGFTLDRAQGGVAAQSAWVDGVPEPSIWTGLRLTGRMRPPATTWRCPECGLLESYANERES